MSKNKTQVEKRNSYLKTILLSTLYVILICGVCVVVISLIIQNSLSSKNVKRKIHIILHSQKEGKNIKVNQLNDHNEENFCDKSFYRNVCFSHRLKKKNESSNLFSIASKNNNDIIRKLIKNTSTYKLCVHHQSILSQPRLLYPQWENLIKNNPLGSKQKNILTESEKISRAIDLILHGGSDVESDFFYHFSSQKDIYTPSYIYKIVENQRICQVLKTLGDIYPEFKDWNILLCNSDNEVKNVQCQPPGIILRILENKIGNSMLKMLLKTQADTLKRMQCLLWLIIRKNDMNINIYQEHFQIFESKFYRFIENVLNWRENRHAGSDYCYMFTRKYMFQKINRDFYDVTKTSKRISNGNIESLVINIKNALIQVMRETPWMSWKTSFDISTKIRGIKISILKPPTQTYNENIEKYVIPQSRKILINNSTIDGVFLFFLELISVNQQILRNTSHPKRNFMNDRLHWNDVYDFHRTPYETVNAWYSPYTNTISIPPGILQEPIFSIYPNFKQKVFIGAIIGHELGHSIDVNGLSFDEIGSYITLEKLNTRHTSTQKRMSRLEEKELVNVMDCLVSEYTNFCNSRFGSNKNDNIKDYHTTDQTKSKSNYGKRTLGENIADQLGVKTSLIYFKTNLLGECSQNSTVNVVGVCVRDFFESYAQVWCTWDNGNHLKTACNPSPNKPLLNNFLDVHALPQHRVDIALRQNKLFRKYYNCKSDCYMSNPKPCIIYT